MYLLFFVCGGHPDLPRKDALYPLRYFSTPRPVPAAAQRVEHAYAEAKAGTAG